VRTSLLQVFGPRIGLFATWQVPAAPGRRSFDHDACAPYWSSNTAESNRAFERPAVSVATVALGAGWVRNCAVGPWSEGSFVKGAVMSTPKERYRSVVEGRIMLVEVACDPCVPPDQRSQALALLGESRSLRVFATGSSPVPRSFPSPCRRRSTAPARSCTHCASESRQTKSSPVTLSECCGTSRSSQSPNDWPIMSFLVGTSGTTWRQADQVPARSIKPSKLSVVGNSCER
jgi:hypothetical protein